MSVIIIVLPKLDNAQNIKRILLTHGFQSAFACSSGASALQMAGQYECGIVLSGYHLSDMYYVELMENLPESYELILLGSPEKVADAGSGMLALTTPLKAYDLLNTVEMVLGQIEHRYRKKKVIKKKRKRGKLYPQCEILVDGEKSSYGAGSLPLFTEIKHGQWHEYGGNGADGFDADV